MELYNEFQVFNSYPALCTAKTNSFRWKVDVIYACSIFPLGLRPPAEGAAKWDSTACQMLLPEQEKNKISILTRQSMLST
jgi:hypothetical protein